MCAAAVGRLCEKCDGKCPVCDSYVRPAVLVRICDECNYGSYQVRVQHNRAFLRSAQSNCAWVLRFAARVANTPLSCQRRVPDVLRTSDLAPVSARAQGRCVICGGPGISDAYYCKECTNQEKDVSTQHPPLSPRTDHKPRTMRVTPHAALSRLPALV